MRHAFSLRTLNAILLATIAAAAFPATLLPADKVLLNESSADFSFSAMDVNAAELDEAYVLQRLRRYFQVNSGKKLIRYTLLPDNLGVQTFGGSGCIHCLPAYGYWRKLYQYATDRPFPIGELLSIRGNAIARFRSQSGAVMEHVVAGTDPRHVRIGGFTGKLVHVGMHGLIANPRIMLYVVGNGMVEAAEAIEFLTRFTIELGVTNVTLELRADPWFMHELARPWFPWFEADRGDFPTEEAFNYSKSLSCQVARFEGKANCDWRGPRMQLP